jgi:hypothetical protein
VPTPRVLGLALWTMRPDLCRTVTLDITAASGAPCSSSSSTSMTDSELLLSDAHRG